MGEVWRATDLVLGREVAVKLLKPEYADDATFRSRFETEARNAAALHHPNVAAVFDFGELPGRRRRHAGGPSWSWSWCAGEPLSALLRSGEPMPAGTRRPTWSPRPPTGSPPPTRSGIVHRDVKPANLIVTPERS